MLSPRPNLKTAPRRFRASSPRQVSALAWAMLAALAGCSLPDYHDSPGSSSVAPDTPGDTMELTSAPVDTLTVLDCARDYLYRGYDLKIAMGRASEHGLEAVPLESLHSVVQKAREDLVATLRRESLPDDLSRLQSTLTHLLNGHSNLRLLGASPLARYVSEIAGEPLPGLRIVKTAAWRFGESMSTPLGEVRYDVADIVATPLLDEVTYRVKVGAWQGTVPLIPVEFQGGTIFRDRETVEAKSEQLFFGRIERLREARDRLEESLRDPSPNAEIGWLVLAKDAIRWRQYRDLWEQARDLPERERRRLFADRFLLAEEKRAALRSAFVDRASPDKLAGAEGAALLAGMAFGDPLDHLAVALGLRAQTLAAPPGAIVPPMGRGAAGAISQISEQLPQRSLLFLVDAPPEVIRQAAAAALGVDLP